MSKEAFTLLRPTRTPDGQGGLLDSFTTAQLLYGYFRVHDDSVSIVGVDDGESVKVQDVIRIDP